MAALNQVLSEVIDVVQEVKQAHRNVPETHALHAALDDLFVALGTWAQALIEQDDAHGLSPLASMPSVAGRTPPNLWPAGASDEEVRRLITQHLERLAQHVAAAQTAQDDEAARGALASIERDLRARQAGLAAEG
jgi:DNA-binding ferritin-like protein